MPGLLLADGVHLKGEAFCHSSGLGSLIKLQTQFRGGKRNKPRTFVGSSTAFSGEVRENEPCIGENARAMNEPGLTVVPENDQVNVKRQGDDDLIKSSCDKMRDGIPGLEGWGS